MPPVEALHAWIRIAIVGVTCGIIAGCGDGTPTAGAPSAADDPGAADVFFSDATQESGIVFDFDRAAAGDYFMPDSMGAGCALLDYDNDGDLDLYIVNGYRERDGRLAGPNGANRLFRQESDGSFRDVTASSGAGHEGYGMGATVGDYDNDGDVDLYITNYGPDALLRNDGGGTFTDVSGAAGIENDAWSASGGFVDYDGDGHLDVFAVNYLDYDDSRRGRDAAGRPEYASPSMFAGAPDVLYRNNGDGTFSDVSTAVGIAGAVGKGLGVVFIDLDGDDRLDVYVANDGEPNFAWINRPDAGFTDEASAIGLAMNRHGQAEAGMGIAVGDCDGDGDLDLFVTHLVLQSNTLYRQESPGSFDDSTASAGLGGPSVDRTGFGTAFLDVDRDGDLDLVTANGRVLRRPPVFDSPLLNDHWRPYGEPNQVFINDGAGRFTDVGARGGAFSTDIEVGRGLAVGDLDRDGDLDLVASNGNGTVRVYRGESKGDGHWLVIRAVDPELNRIALGAVVEVRAAGRRLRRDARAAYGYLSSGDGDAHFGLGDAESVDEIVIVWPGGERETFEGCRADQSIVIRKGTGR